MNIVSVILARGGSKGIPKKNLIEINGTPLVCIAGACAKKINQIDKVVVSTECDEITTVSKAYGLEVPIKRPKKYSGDSVKDINVLLHG